MTDFISLDVYLHFIESNKPVLTEGQMPMGKLFGRHWGYLLVCVKCVYIYIYVDYNPMAGPDYSTSRKTQWSSIYRLLQWLSEISLFSSITFAQASGQRHCGRQIILQPSAWSWQDSRKWATLVELELESGRACGVWPSQFVRGVKHVRKRSSPGDLASGRVLPGGGCVQPRGGGVLQTLPRGAQTFGFILTICWVVWSRWADGTDYGSQYLSSTNTLLLLTWKDRSGFAVPLRPTEHNLWCHWHACKIKFEPKAVLFLNQWFF